MHQLYLQTKCLILLKHIQKIFTGFEITTQFERNSYENVLYTDENNECKGIFEDLSLMLAHIELKNSARRLYEELCVSSEPIKWNHYEIYRTNKIKNDDFVSCQIPLSSDEVLMLIVILQYLERTIILRKIK